MKMFELEGWKRSLESVEVCVKDGDLEYIEKEGRKLI